MSSQNVSRRKFLKYAAAGAAAVVVVGAGGWYYLSQQKPSLQTLSVKFGTPVKTSSEWVPVYFADSKSLWSQYALNTQIANFTGDATLTQAFASGDVTMGITNALLPLRARDNGIPLQIVAQLTSVNDFVLIVGPNANYSSPKDLSGGKVGVTTIGGLLDAQVQDLASANNIKIQSIPLGGLDAQLTALSQGQVNGFCWSWDGGWLAQDKGIGKIVLHFSDIYPQWKTNQVVTAHENMVKNNPDAVKRMLQAIFGTVKYMNSHVSDVTTFAQGYLGLSSQSAQKAWQDQNFSTDGTINDTGISFAAQLLARTSPMKSPPQIDATVNKSFTPVQT